MYEYIECDVRADGAADGHGARAARGEAAEGARQEARARGGQEARGAATRARRPPHGPQARAPLLRDARQAPQPARRRRPLLPPAPGALLLLTQPQLVLQ